ncbi:hypothetical protein H4S01_003500 [Coemansia sp. RSA 2610]|nr:hypothetical protein H4S01_003500 [Coemansia sp. RSA 2610]
MDIRDVRVAETIEHPLSSERIPDNVLLQAIEAANGTNPNKDCRRWLALVRELQKETGDKHNIRQINTKHINTRSRWSVPFKSLNEVGYLIKNQTLRGAKRAASKGENLPLRRTNIGKKNLASIKAIRKYMRHKNLFWNYRTQSVPDKETYALICGNSPELEDVSEPERWIRAMIRRHGAAMIDYMDKCAANLANSYIRELNDAEPSPDRQGALATTGDQELICRVLGEMIDEILQKGRPRAKSTSASRRGSKSARVPPLDIPLPELDYSALGSRHGATPGLGHQGEEALEPISSGSPTTPTGPLLIHQRPQTPTPAGVKRSKSHVFSAPGPAKEPSSTLTSSVSYTNMPAYDSVASIANTLLQSSTGTAPIDTRSSNGQYDEGLFTQFINYDTMNHSQASVHDQRAGRKNSEQLAPDIVDAIINLSVDKGANSIDQTDYNYLHTSGHDRTTVYYPHSHPVSARRPSDATSFDQAYGEVSSKHLNIPSYPHPDMHETPTSLSRVTSDENQQQRGSYSYAQGMATKQQDAHAELQSIFGNKGQGFTFQVPSYNWPANSSNAGANTLPHQQSSNGVSESFSMPSLASYASTASVAAGRGMSINTPVNYAMQLPLNSAGAQSGQTTATPGQQLPRMASQPGPLPQGKSQLSTTLIIINNVPSHIELTHDNAGIHPNPIILPISHVVREGGN